MKIYRIGVVVMLLCGLFLVSTGFAEPPPKPPPLKSPLDTMDIAWGMTVEDIKTSHSSDIMSESLKNETTNASLIVAGITTLMDLPVESRFGLFFDEQDKLMQVTSMMNTLSLTTEQHLYFFAMVCASLQSAYGEPDGEGRAWKNNEPIDDMDLIVAIFSGALAFYAEWVLDNTLVTVELKGNGQAFFVIVFYEDLSKDSSRMSELYPQLPAEVMKL